MVNSLEQSLRDSFDGMPFDYCPLGGRQVSLRELDPAAPTGEHLELDGAICSGRTCVIVEITGQKSDNRAKIRRFIRHCRLFRNSTRPLRERFRLIGVPATRLNKFEDVNQWRYLYIGTSDELRADRIRSNSFGESDAPLTIFWDEEWSYFRLLAKNIGRFAVGELFAALQLIPGHEDGAAEQDLRLPFIQLERRRLAKKMPKADIFVTYMSAHELLTMCRVLRYHRLPITVEAATGDAESTGYQRLLIPDKLKSIRAYLDNDATVAFPNAITVVNSAGSAMVDEAARRLIIPHRYASLDVIDGQHRLFSYAHPDISDHVRKNAHLLTTIIAFDDSTDRKHVEKYAASLFITINQTQARVKTELLYLTAFDAMGADSGEAIAGKVLIKLNDRKNGPLTGMLRVRPLIQHRSGGRTPIPIVTIVQELAPLLDKKRIASLSQKVRRHIISVLDTDERKVRSRNERLRIGIELLNRYFSQVKKIFKDDFASPESSLLCAKYIAALIRLLHRMLTEDQSDWGTIAKQLEKLKKRALQRSGNTLAFPSTNDAIPSKKASVKDIDSFFAECLR